MDVANPGHSIHPCFSFFFFPHRSSRNLHGPNPVSNFCNPFVFVFYFSIFPSPWMVGRGAFPRSPSQVLLRVRAVRYDSHPSTCPEAIVSPRYSLVAPNFEGRPTTTTDGNTRPNPSKAAQCSFPYVVPLPTRLLSPNWGLFFVAEETHGTDWLTGCQQACCSIWLYRSDSS